MDINDQTVQLNAFTEGLNTDQSLMSVNDNSYIMAKNLRVASRNNINGRTNNVGDLMPINEPLKLNIRPNYKDVLAAQTINDYGVIIYVNYDDRWAVDRYNKTDNSFTTIFVSDTNYSEKDYSKKFSIQLRYESADVIHLYIADGVDPIIQLNILNEYTNKKVSDVISYPQSDLTAPTFSGYTNGQLKAGMVMYSYQLYNRNGSITELSPSTNFIPITKDRKGFEQGTQTSVGIILGFEFNASDESRYSKMYIYRVLYEQNGQLPIITKVYDGEKVTAFVDDGSQSLQELTVEEYNSMTGIHIIPKSIESKNNILFAANISQQQSLIEPYLDQIDTTAVQYQKVGTNYISYVYENYSDYVNGLDAQVYSSDNKIGGDTFNSINDMSKPYSVDGNFNCCLDPQGYYGGAGDIINWRFIVTQWRADNKRYKFDKVDFTPAFESQYMVTYDGHHIRIDTDNNDRIYNTKNYRNNISTKRTLRRGELYRYGIVFYDKYGTPSPAKWVADIRVPSASTPGFELFDTDDNFIYLNAIGVRFHVDWDKIPEHIRNNINGYEIVRCVQHQQDVHVIAQGIISRPIHNVYPESYNDLTYGNKRTEYTPIGFMTTGNYWTGNNWFAHDETMQSKEISGHEADNFDNRTLFQFASPEYSYLKDSTINNLENKTLYVEPSLYLYSNGYDDNDYSNPTYNMSIPTSKDSDGDNRHMHVESQKFSFSFYQTKYEYSEDDPVFSCYNPATGSIYTPGDKNHWAQVAKMVTAYVKLYEKETSSLQARPYLVNGTDKFVSIKDQSYEIDDIEPAVELTWNQFGTDDKTKLTVTADSAGACTIGDKTFVNWSFGGNLDVDSGDFINTDDSAGNLHIGEYEEGTNVKTNGASGNYILGPGGRQLVFTVKDDNNILSRTIGVGEDSGQSRNRYRNSMSGTYLCNICQSVTPYYGYTEQSRKLCTYAMYGDYVSKNNKHLIVYDGDTYVQLFEYASMHKYYDPVVKNSMTMNIMYSVPVETNINIEASNGFKFSDHMDNEYISNIQTEPANVNGLLTQDSPMYRYNSAYSINTSPRVSAAYDEEASKDSASTEQPFRCYYSNVKDNNEANDTWLKYMPANYIDVDSKYGNITDLYTFKNDLLFWQEKSFGKFSANERALVNDVSNNNLILGDSGVLSRYDYIDTIYGMHEGDRSKVQSQSALYWVDSNNNEILRLGEGVEQLSKTKSVYNYVHNNIDMSGNKIYLMYDRKNNEIVLSFPNSQINLAYSEFFQRFIGLYDYTFTGDLQFSDALLTINNGDIICSWDNGTENRMYILLTFVMNKSGLITKVFDNQEIITPNNNSGDRYNNKFDDLTFEYSTDLTETSEQHIDMTNREGNFRYAIPRTIPEEQYGNRLRGKYAVCTIKGNVDKDTAVSYIKTKFRQSVS